MTRLIILFVFALPAQLLGQSPEYERKLEQLYSHTVPTISSMELGRLIASEKGVIILDTRQKTEFEVSHIRGAVFSDYEGFKIQDLDHLSKDANIVVYCSVGYRSEKVGEALLEAGFSNVRNLYGGIFQWVNEGLPVYDSNSNLTTRVHTYNKRWSVWLKRGIKIYE